MKRRRALASRDAGDGVRRGVIPVALAITVSCTFWAPATGMAQYINVSGTGEVLARPTHVEIHLSAGGAAELTADANQKCCDAVRRTTDAFKQLDVKDLTIEERELSFTGSAPGRNAVRGVVIAGGGGMVARGGVDPAARAQVGMSRSLRVVLGNIQQQDEAALRVTIGTLIDTARDTGATVLQNAPSAPMSLVTFVVDDADKQLENAYEKAFDAAKSRATRLARLAGATLGPVNSISEQQTGVAYSPRSAALNLNSDGDARLMSDTLGDIPVRVTLHVSFALKARDDPDSDDEEEESK